MRPFSLLVALLALALVLASLPAIAAEMETVPLRAVAKTQSAVVDKGNPATGPDGKYCGSFSVGLIKGELHVHQPKQVFDIHLEGMNHNRTCSDEAYRYDRPAERLIVPGAEDPADCLGDLLASAKLHLNVTYAPDVDNIRLDLGFTFIDCHPCDCTTPRGWIPRKSTATDQGIEVGHEAPAALQGWVGGWEFIYTTPVMLSNLFYYSGFMKLLLCTFARCICYLLDICLLRCHAAGMKNSTPSKTTGDILRCMVLAFTPSFFFLFPFTPCIHTQNNNNNNNNFKIINPPPPRMLETSNSSAMDSCASDFILFFSFFKIIVLKEIHTGVPLFLCIKSSSLYRLLPVTHRFPPSSHHSPFPSDIHAESFTGQHSCRIVLSLLNSRLAFSSHAGIMMSALQEKIYAHRELKRVAVLRRHLLAQWRSVFLSRYHRRQLELLQLDSSPSGATTPSLPAHLDPFLQQERLRGVIRRPIFFQHVCDLNPDSGPPAADLEDERSLFRSRVRIPLTPVSDLLLPAALGTSADVAGWRALTTALSVFRGSNAQWNRTVELIMNSIAFQELHRAVEALQPPASHQNHSTRSPPASPPRLCICVERGESTRLSAGGRGLATPLGSNPRHYFYVDVLLLSEPDGAAMKGVLRRRGRPRPEELCLARERSLDLRLALRQAIHVGLEKLSAVIADRPPPEGEAGATAAPPQPVIPPPHTSFFRTPPMRGKRDRNSFSIPDVGLMIAEMERLSQTKVVLECSQEARHEPQRRVQQLLQGLSGDVDVYTRISARLAGTELRCTAFSHPTPTGVQALPGEGNNEDNEEGAFGSGGSPSVERTARQLDAWRQAGVLRGPLLLLVEAICGLYKQVAGESPALVGSCAFPVLSVRRPQSREGLDFLLYSWFGSPPQIRIFDIQPHRVRHRYVYQGRRYDTIVRAMLFYDLLGHRLLFAETHHWELSAAMDRLHRLAVELNMPRTAIHPTPPRAVPRQPPPASSRAFRAVSDAAYGDLRRNTLRRLVESAATGTAAPPAAPHCLPAALLPGHRGQRGVLTIPAAFFQNALLRCVRRQPSRLVALLAVLEGFGSLSIRCTEGESAGGVAEMLLRVWPTRQLQDRRRALRTARAGAEAAAAEDPALLLLLPVTGRVLRFHQHLRPAANAGLLPTLTLLCERLLAALYESVPQLADRLCPLPRLLQAAIQADPLCADPRRPTAPRGSSSTSSTSAAPSAPPLRRHGFLPPFNARFYTPPNLVGELLQGLCGGYECTYALQPLQATDGSSNDTERAAMIAMDRSQPSTDLFSSATTATRETPPPIFYATARPTHRVVVEMAEAANTAAHDADAVPVECRWMMCFRCIITVPQLLGKAATTGAGRSGRCFVLGVGEGRTQREAWQAAALSALQWNFPDAMRQVPLWRKMCELAQDPKVLHELGMSSAGFQFRFHSPSADRRRSRPPPALSTSDAAPHYFTRVVSAAPGGVALIDRHAKEEGGGGGEGHRNRTGRHVQIYGLRLFPGNGICQCRPTSLEQSGERAVSRPCRRPHPSRRGAPRATTPRARRTCGASGSAQSASDGRLEMGFLEASALLSPSSTYRGMLADALATGATETSRLLQKLRHEDLLGAVFCEGPGRAETAPLYQRDGSKQGLFLTPATIFLHRLRTAADSSSSSRLSPTEMLTQLRFAASSRRGLSQA
eukprot:gene11226-7797_t